MDDIAIPWHEVQVLCQETITRSANKTKRKHSIVKVLKYRNLTAPFQKQRLNLKTFKKKTHKVYWRRCKFKILSGERQTKNG